MTKINKEEHAKSVLEKFNKERGFNCSVTDVEKKDKYFHLEGEFSGWKISGQGDIDENDFYVVRAEKDGVMLSDSDSKISATLLSSYRKAPVELSVKKMKIEAEINKLKIDLDTIEKEIRLVNFS